MILHFPTLEILKLALLSEAIPATVSVTPVTAAFSEKGDCWVETDKSLTKQQLVELGKLRVTVENVASHPLTERLHCWPQLLPLQKEHLHTEVAEKTPVLFEVPSETQFADLVSEILRLGNDRQSYRWLSNGKQTTALLRVVGPPYYSLLRAVDQTQVQDSPKAYREVSPRVWVQVGFTHPLVNKLRPGPGKLLFLRPPLTWFMLEEAKFHDIYEILEFQLPHFLSAWKEESFEKKIPVPLRLTTGTTTEPAELWVLRDNALSQLDDLVRTADEQLLSRLSFAVGQQGEASLIVLRVRPSKQAPPVLVLEGTAYRSFLRLPNLFVPVGYRLYPTLRRDAVVSLLASDTSRITWLHPQGEASFVPESLPDTAFRPLPDWVQYVLDHEQKPLEAWMQAARFDFEPFICKDEITPTKEPPPKQEVSKAHTPKNKEAAASSVRKESTEPLVKPTEEAYIAPRLPKTQPEIEKKLREVEQQFLQQTSPLDAPERRHLWHQMAHYNLALGHATDATVCWSHALWEGDQPPVDWWQGWQQSEARAVSGGHFGLEQLAKLLQRTHPSPSEMRALAAFLGWAAHTSPMPELAPQLGAIQQYLEKHEELLPVRAVWLAWVSLGKLMQGDVLTLARARDRLLERLHLRGQSPELDLPAFLRFTGAKATERLRGMKDHLLSLEGLILQWLDQRLAKWRERKQPKERAPYTEAYARLILAYGFACLGATREAQRLTQAAMEALTKTDDLNTWLLTAFQFRIERALRDRGTVTPLPPELLKRLENYVPDRGDKREQRRLEKQSIEKAREKLAILEPHSRVTEYERHLAPFKDDLNKELMPLVSVLDRQELLGRVKALLENNLRWAKAQEAPARILERALERAPLLGATFAGDLLTRVEPVLEQTKDLTLRASILEKALYLAAHFDHANLVQRLVGRIHVLFTQQKEAGAFQEMESVLDACLHGLRKVGMRNEIHGLLTQVSELILGRQDLIMSLMAPKAPTDALLRTKALEVLLHVASGWFYTGHNDLAWPIVDQAREVLFHGNPAGFIQTNLACAYVRTLGLAPIDKAMPRVEELLRTVDRIEDGAVSKTHFVISMLCFVEATVLALVSDELTMDKDARRWLDDDEYLVRRRIHCDVREAMHGAGL